MTNPSMRAALGSTPTTHPGDSDPDPDEALRRVRQGRPPAGAR